jgi:hypothetical protein
MDFSSFQSGLEATNLELIDKILLKTSVKSLKFPKKLRFFKWLALEIQSKLPKTPGNFFAVHFL